MVPLWLLLIFITCTALSVLLCYAAKLLFPRFRSGEFKPGLHRADLQPGFHRSDLPASGREIKTIELPLVGGPAIILSLIATGIAAGFLLKFHQDQWTLLVIGLGATFGYMLVGFVDDWFKVFTKEGISERNKVIGLVLVSIVAALLYFFLLDNGKQPYYPYIDLPIIGPLLCPIRHDQLAFCKDSVHLPDLAYFVWLILIVIITSVIASVTSLSVDFSDGLDGLAGGLVFSAALAFGIIITGNLRNPSGVVLEVLSLLCAGSTLGFLPWNWPSSWAARRATAKRRAKIYMGDSGALGLGGILAMVAIFSRNELLLLMVGGAFVLEGLSALISARLMTRFFRKHLQLLRFANSKEFVPHTEFPLPFLATPLHHHFDLLAWDRRRLVYGAWALGACFAALGVMITLAPFTWERYLGRILVLILAGIIWSSGSWSKNYFVGEHPPERTRRRRLALYYGYPYKLMGLQLYHLVEIIEASEDVNETPAENIALWQRMNIFDARSMLGLYCYRAGYYPAALAQWTRIPERNRILRPEIARLLAEVDNRLALEKHETQPMRRDQIFRQQPILSGNLPPADLPNPHEPVRREETQERDIEAWSSRKASAFVLGGNGGEMQSADQLVSETFTSSAHEHSTSSSSGRVQSLVSLGSLQTSTTRQNWWSRLLRFSSDE